MELDELRQLTAWLLSSDLRCLELSRPGERVRLTVADGSRSAVSINDDKPDAPAAISAGHPGSGAVVVRTESAGLFTLTHPMRNEPFVKIGDRVRENAVLGLLKIGLLYAPITAPTPGIVTKITATDGALLGFGSPVLELEPTST
jgi:biotin carboxyl carrier protein